VEKFGKNVSAVLPVLALVVDFHHQGFFLFAHFTLV
jgi:hypothetical protein